MTTPDSICSALGRKRTLLRLATIAIVMMLCTVVDAQSVKPNPEPQISVNARFTALNHKRPISLSDHRGKVVVLTLWASWCFPCTAAIFDFQKLAVEFAKHDVVVLGLTTEDPLRDRANVAQFLKTSDITYELGWIGAISARKLMGGRDAIPQIFVIRDGVILQRFIGWNPVSTPAQVRDAVKQHLVLPATTARASTSPN